MTEERYSNTLRIVLKAHSRLAETVMAHSVWPETVFKKFMTSHSKLGETAHNMIAPVLNVLKGRKSSLLARATAAARRSLARIWLIHDGGLLKASRNCENNSAPPRLYSVLGRGAGVTSVKM